MTQVVEYARTDLGRTFDLSDGSTFSEINNISSRVVDREGDTVPSLDITLGLFNLSSSSVLDHAAVSETMRELGYPATTDLQSYLVQITTADLDMASTHAGVDDRAAIDISFLDDIGPDDTFQAMQFFAQTLPGDAEVEKDMSPMELFTYRWNNGLVSVRGMGGEVAPLLADSIPVSVAADQTPAPSALQATIAPGPMATSTNITALAHRSPRGTTRLSRAGEVADITPLEILTAIKATELALIPISGARTGSESFEALLVQARLAQEERDRNGVPPVCSPSGCVPAHVFVDTTIGGVTYCIGHNEYDSGTVRLGVRSGEVCENASMRPYTATLMLQLLHIHAACVETTTRQRYRNIILPALKKGRTSPGLDEFGLTTTTTSPPDPATLCNPPDLPSDEKVAGTFGDIHVRNFDGWDYDNQAAGEFLMFDNGTATVQIRTEPMDDVVTSGFDVSVTTAVGVDIDSHSVSMHNNGDLFVDGAMTDLGRGATLEVGNGAVVWSGGEWTVVWADGTKMRININLPDMLVFVTAAPGDVRGMFGNFDGDPANDWFTRDGQPLDADIRFADDFYSTYVDSWRISQDESLLHYATGESTETFTLEGFPSAPATTDRLDPVAESEALEACAAAGITRRDVLDDCILDVALTGDLSFTYGAFLTQSSTVAAPVEPVSTTPSTNPPPIDAGDTSLSIGSFTIGFGAEPPVVAENSFAPSWQCQATDASLFATSRFMETADRQLNITIQYTDGSSTGTDDRFAFVVELNSQPYAWMQSALQPPPGTIEMLSYDGSTLTASGTAFLNEPINTSLFPASVLPPGTAFEPFMLHVSC